MKFIKRKDANLVLSDDEFAELVTIATPLLKGDTLKKGDKIVAILEYDFDAFFIQGEIVNNFPDPKRFRIKVLVSELPHVLHDLHTEICGMSHANNEGYFIYIERKYLFRAK